MRFLLFQLLKFVIKHFNGQKKTIIHDLPSSSKYFKQKVEQFVIPKQAGTILMEREIVAGSIVRVLLMDSVAGGKSSPSSDLGRGHWIRLLYIPSSLPTNHTIQDLSFELNLGMLLEKEIESNFTTKERYEVNNGVYFVANQASARASSLGLSEGGLQADDDDDGIVIQGWKLKFKQDEGCTRSIFFSLARESKKTLRESLSLRSLTSRKSKSRVGGIFGKDPLTPSGSAPSTPGTASPNPKSKSNPPSFQVDVFFKTDFINPDAIGIKCPLILVAEGSLKHKKEVTTLKTNDSNLKSSKPARKQKKQKKQKLKTHFVTAYRIGMGDSSAVMPPPPGKKKKKTRQSKDWKPLFTVQPVLQERPVSSYSSIN